MVGHEHKLHIRRRGRLSRAQARAIEDLGPIFMLSPDAPLDQMAHFGREAPLMLEIGFGTGSALVDFAVKHPQMNCLGMEVYQPGIGNALQEIHAKSLHNLRLMECDARAAVEIVFKARCLERIHIYFPDPWPKKRHHKRRLVNRQFVSMLASKLCAGGVLRLATDDAHYARRMLETCDAESSLSNLAGAGNFAADSDLRPSTRFEQRGEMIGNEIFDLAFRHRSEKLADD